MTLLRYGYVCLVLIGTAGLLSGCGGWDDAEDVKPPPDLPNIAGIWAGNWHGNNADIGFVAGSWVAEISQSGQSAHGTARLRGDIDCPDAVLDGEADTQEEIVTGTLQRSPCVENEWIITSLDPEQKTVTGAWTQPGGDSQGAPDGGFGGERIATLTGPRIDFSYPPGGAPGSYVSVVGRGFPASLIDVGVSFDGEVADIVSFNEERMVLRVPDAAPVGRIRLNTPAGSAASPYPFDASVGSPELVVTGYLEGWTQAASALAFNPDGYRAYELDSVSGWVFSFDTTTGSRLGFEPADIGPSPNPQAHSIVPSPDGQFLFVAVDGAVNQLHAYGLGHHTSYPMAIGGGNPGVQLLALSFDGRFLVGIENIDGGSVTVLDRHNGYAVYQQHRVSSEFRPAAVVVGPKNDFFYVALDSSTEIPQLRQFRFGSCCVERTYQLDHSPGAIAASWDAANVLVAHPLNAALTLIDLGNESQSKTILDPAVIPAGMAITPDNAALLVSDAGGARLLAFDLTLLPIGELSLPYPSTEVAVSPDGSRAYAALTNGLVVDIGGLKTLNILKRGTGTVTSDTGGIECGTKCRGNFLFGQAVKLSTNAASIGASVSWSPECSQGELIMDANKVCTVTFYSASSSDSSGTTGGSSDCFIATAAYGSHLEPQVMVLRRFRDNYLLGNSAGEMLVRAYYRYSPPIADVIRQSASLRWFTRALLTPLVLIIAQPLFGILLLALAVVLYGGWRNTLASRRKVMGETSAAGMNWG